MTVNMTQHYRETQQYNEVSADLLTSALLGPEPLHVHPSDLHAALHFHGPHAGLGHAPLPGDWQHAGLCSFARSTLHRCYRGYTGVHGRTHY